MSKLKHILVVILFFSFVFARENYKIHVRQIASRLKADAGEISRSPQRALQDMGDGFKELDFLNLTAPFLLESSPWAAYRAHKIIGLEKSRVDIYLQVAQLEEDAEIAHNNNPQADLSTFVSQYRTKMHEYAALVDEVNAELEVPVPDEIYDALVVLEK